MQAVGLRTHIWNNNLKSILLLVLFPLLVLAVVYALLLIAEGASGADIGKGLVRAGGNLSIAAPIAFPRSYAVALDRLTYSPLRGQ